jgi:acyl carrier protein
VSPDDIRRGVVAALLEVAPEIEPAKLDPKADLRSSFDLDSMDFLNFVIGVGTAFGVDIPEADYRKLASVDACVAYVAGRLT